MPPARNLRGKKKDERAATEAKLPASKAILSNNKAQKNTGNREADADSGHDACKVNGDIDQERVTKVTASGKTKQAGSAPDQAANHNAEISAKTRTSKKRRSDEKSDSPPKKAKQSSQVDEKVPASNIKEEKEAVKNNPVQDRSRKRATKDVTGQHSKISRPSKVQQSSHFKRKGHKPGKEVVNSIPKDVLPEKMKVKEIAAEAAGTVGLMSDDSGSDSDFEEVHTQFRTPETSGSSISLSDLGVSRKLEDSFSDMDCSQDERRKIKGTSSQTFARPSEVSKKKKTTSSSAKSNLAHDKPASDASTKQKPSQLSKKKDSKTSDTRATEAKKTAKNSFTASPKKRHAHAPSKVDENNVMAILLKMEGQDLHKTISTTAGASTSETTGAKKEKGTSNRKDSDKPASDASTKAKGTSKQKPSQLSKKKDSKTSDTHATEAKKTAKNLSTASPKKRHAHATSKVDENDVMAILLKMEGQDLHKTSSTTAGASTSGTTGAKKEKGISKRKDSALYSDTDESDWEEVEDYKHSPMKSQIPTEPVQITINDPSMLYQKRQKKKFDWKAYVKRRIKRLAKETQVDMHKVHLLCLLSFGMQQNRTLGDATLVATALSLVPPEHLKKKVAKYSSQDLLVVIRWFRSTFSLGKITDAINFSLVPAKELTAVLSETMASEPRLFVMALVVLLRAMGFTVRLVISLNPLPLKISQASAPKSGSKRKKENSSEEIEEVWTKTQNKALSTGSKNASTSKTTPKSSTKSSKTSQQQQKSGKKRKPAPKKSRKPETESSSSSSDDDSDEMIASRKQRSARSSTIKKKKPGSKAVSAAGGDSEREESEPELSDMGDSGSNFSDEECVQKKRRSKESAKQKGKKVLALEKEHGSDGEDASEEFEESFSVRKSLVKENSFTKQNRKILSSESSDGSPCKSQSGRNYWLEVFLPSERKWIGVDCIRCAVDKPYDISAVASLPLLYIMAFDNYGNVKDITAKYAPQWLSQTRKQRVDSEWWRESLEPYATLNEELDDLENDNIKAHLMQRPLPTNIGEYKNHPLYALSRHLLKYEAIYPENSIPVGYIRHEPVYARECVHTLHSRENWLREARVVRVGETAYKRAKSRKCWNKARDNPEELDLELFGFWQTEKYIPPPAVNGKVPKNEYGNVELFQPCMLPGGTVHLHVPALNRVAKKLGIDIAAAMTGWDHHCGFSHPLLDGWIVCEEHKDVLLAAWEEDQEIQRLREEERREKRVLNNWTTLVRGLLIKDKLKKKFNLEEKKPAPKTKKEAPIKQGEVATDVQHAWPAKQQQEQKKKPNKSKTLPQPTHYIVETM